MSRQFKDVLARHVRLKGLHVGILVFPSVEVLDFAGPLEVFSLASRVCGRDFGIEQPFRVSLIGADRNEIAATHGLRILAHYTFNNARELDLVIVPGGQMVRPLGCQKTRASVNSAGDRPALIASVCPGAFLLASLGVLDGHPVVTHWEDIIDLRAQFPELDVKEKLPFIDSGGVITSPGISAGISMSLHLVERVLRAEISAATAPQIEYDWMPSVSQPFKSSGLDLWKDIAFNALCTLAMGRELPYTWRAETGQKQTFVSRQRFDGRMDVRSDNQAL